MKSCLVAKGYAKQEDIDFEETFAPTYQMITIRLVTRMAAHFGLKVYQLDIKTTFLNGELQEEVYVTQPASFVKPSQDHQVCCLNKALYGLKQAPKPWYQKIHMYLTSKGFTNNSIESTMHTLKDGDDLLIVILYVDDMFVTDTNEEQIKAFIAKLNFSFDMSDIGLLYHF